MNNKMEYFKRYLKEEKLRNKAYDCSEIADDLFEYFKEGKVLNIIVEGGGGSEGFFVEEWGQKIECMYHMVYECDGYVFDPRYRSEPVLLRDYMDFLRDLNDVELGILVDRD